MTLQEKLTQAEDAYHKLMLGQTVVEVRDSNGETIRYTTANANRLATYIQELRRQLGGTSGRPAGVLM